MPVAASRRAPPGREAHEHDHTQRCHRPRTEGGGQGVRLLRGAAGRDERNRGRHGLGHRQGRHRQQEGHGTAGSGLRQPRGRVAGLRPRRRARGARRRAPALVRRPATGLRRPDPRHRRRALDQRHGRQVARGPAGGAGRHRAAASAALRGARRRRLLRRDRRTRSALRHRSRDRSRHRSRGCSRDRLRHRARAHAETGRGRRFDGRAAGHRETREAPAGPHSRRRRPYPTPQAPAAGRLPPPRVAALAQRPDAGHRGDDPP